MALFFTIRNPFCNPRFFRARCCCAWSESHFGGGQIRKIKHLLGKSSFASWKQSWGRPGPLAPRPFIRTFDTISIISGGGFLNLCEVASLCWIHFWILHQGPPPSFDPENTKDTILKASHNAERRESRCGYDRTNMSNSWFMLHRKYNENCW